jgi:hypothetical protein
MLSYSQHGRKKEEWNEILLTDCICNTYYVKEYLYLKLKYYLKKTAFWNLAPCSLEVDRRFRGSCSLCYQGDDGGSTHSLNIRLLQRD